MKIEEIAHCGLNYELCKRMFSDIREKIKILDESFETINMKEITKAILFMKSKYRGYKKLTGFFSQECPECRNKGGNPFCGIRKMRH